MLEVRGFQPGGGDWPRKLIFKLSGVGMEKGSIGQQIADGSATALNPALTFGRAPIPGKNPGCYPLSQNEIAMEGSFRIIGKDADS